MSLPPTQHYVACGPALPAPPAYTGKARQHRFRRTEALHSPPAYNISKSWTILGISLGPRHIPRKACFNDSLFREDSCEWRNLVCHGQRQLGGAGKADRHGPVRWLGRRSLGAAGVAVLITGIGGRQRGTPAGSRAARWRQRLRAAAHRRETPAPDAGRVGRPVPVKSPSGLRAGGLRCGA